MIFCHKNLTRSEIWPYKWANVYFKLYEAVHLKIQGNHAKYDLFCANIETFHPPRVKAQHWHSGVQIKFNTTAMCSGLSCWKKNKDFQHMNRKCCGPGMRSQKHCLKATKSEGCVNKLLRPPIVSPKPHP